MEKKRFFVKSTGKFYNVPADKVDGFMAKFPDASPVDASGQPIPAAAPVVAPEPSAAAPSPAEPETTVSGALGGFARGAAPYALGGTIGAVLGGLAGGIPSGGIGAAPGAAAGAELGVGAMALASLISEVITPLLNSATGTNQKTINQVVESILTEAGVAEPKTAAERTVQAVTSGAYGGAGMGAAGQAIGGAGSFTAPTVKELVLKGLTAGGVEGGAAAGGAAGLGSQAVAEMGGGPTAQMLAGMGAGMLAGRPLSAPMEPGSVPMSRLEAPSGLMPKAQEAVRKWADEALLARGGPELAAKLEKGTLRTSPEETARVMREIPGLTETWTPAGLAKKAGAVRAESGGLLGRIRAEVDRQASALTERATASRQAGEAKKAELTAKYADKVKAAEAAAKNADELEKTANDAAKRLADEQAELHRAALKVGEANRPPQTPAPGVTVVPSEIPATEGQVPLRSIVGAQKTINARQREVKMMADAAKKARAEADRLAKEAAPSSYEHAASQVDIMEAERLAGEAGKRMVSGKDVAAIIRREAAAFLKEQEAQDISAMSGSQNRAEYNALLDEAKRLEASGEMSVSAAQKRIEALRKTSKHERSPTAAIQPKAEASKSVERALGEAQTGAISQAEQTPELADILSQRLSRLGRGKVSIEETPSAEEAYLSMKRAYEVGKPLSKSAKAEAERVAKLGLTPSRVTQMLVPSVKSKMLEAATSALGTPSARPEMSMMENMPAAYLAALSEIDQSLNPENPEEQQSMVTP